MPLTELQAQQIALVRVLEQTRDNGGVWAAGDAREATRAARELAGPRAAFDAFVARRAQWALEEIGRRTPAQAIRLHAVRGPFWAGLAVALCALLAGFATDYLAAQPHIDIVEWPLVLLIGWNLLVFAWGALAWLWRFIRRGSGSQGPLAGLLGAWWAAALLGLRGAGARPWAPDFKRAWAALSAPLQGARVRLFTHLSALLFALGALASLFTRGISEEYRAGWKTTYAFVDGALLHAIVSVVLAPGSWLLGMPIPDAQHIARLRMPQSPGEIAEPWIWLYCASVLAWVVVPSRYELSPGIRSRLATLLERIYGLAGDISLEPPVLMGRDATDWKQALHREGHVAVVVLFNLAATAESDAHGVLLQQLRRSVERDTPIVPVVDMGGFPRADTERWRQRCNQWRHILDKVHFKPLFLDLQQAGDEDLQALHHRLNHDD